MRSFAKWMLVVGLAAVMAGPSLAQEQKGRRGGQGKGGAGQGQGRGGMFGGRGGLWVLAIPAVQEEIKATDDQKEKIGELMRNQFQAQRDLGQDASQEDRNKLRQKNTEEQEKFAKDTLKPDQLKRYSQIKWQQASVVAFKDPEVQTSLKLTGDQKEKLNALAEDYTKDRNEISPPFGGGRRQGGGQGKAGGGRGFGPDPETLQKLAKLSKDSMVKAEKVLTDSQQKEWKDLLGKPFEMPAFGGGRRGGQDKDK